MLYATSKSTLKTGYTTLVERQSLINFSGWIQFPGIRFHYAQPRRNKMQHCETCGGSMKPLFISFFCPACESGGNESSATGNEYSGFVINRGRPDGSSEYIFENIEDAKKWRFAAGLSKSPIWMVSTNKCPTWKQSTGSVPGILVARELVAVYKSEESWEPRNTLQGCWVDEVVPGEPT